MGIHNELHRRRVMLELRHLYGPEVQPQLKAISVLPQKEGSTPIF